MTESVSSNRSGASRTVAGVLLCGGRSRRMGFDKAWLPWDGGWALVRIGEALAERCDRVLVVKRPGQSLPPTPKAWLIVDDDEPGAGPLAALATAYRALDGMCDACLVATCDQSPATLRAAVATLLVDEAAQLEVSRILVDGERRQPFPGLYAMTALREAADARESGAASMRAFLDRLGQRIELRSSPLPLADWDDPEAYFAVARAAGFEPPHWCRAALRNYAS